MEFFSREFITFINDIWLLCFGYMLLIKNEIISDIHQKETLNLNDRKKSKRYNYTNLFHFIGGLSGLIIASYYFFTVNIQCQQDEKGEYDCNRSLALLISYNVLFSILIYYHIGYQICSYLFKENILLIIGIPLWPIFVILIPDLCCSINFDVIIIKSRLNWIYNIFIIIDFIIDIAISIILLKGLNYLGLLSIFMVIISLFKRLYITRIQLLSTLNNDMVINEQINSIKQFSQTDWERLSEYKKLKFLTTFDMKQSEVISLINTKSLSDEMLVYLNLDN